MNSTYPMTPGVRVKRRLEHRGVVLSAVTRDNETKTDHSPNHSQCLSAAVAAEKDMGICCNPHALQPG